MYYEVKGRVNQEEGLIELIIALFKSSHNICAKKIQEGTQKL